MQKSSPFDQHLHPKGALILNRLLLTSHIYKKIIGKKEQLINKKLSIYRAGHQAGKLLITQMVARFIYRAAAPGKNYLFY